MKEAETKIEAQLSELFHWLRAVDEALSPGDFCGPRFLVKHLEEIQIRMDANKNHGRGHVHIKYKKDGHAASYAIDTGQRLAGDESKLPRYYDAIISRWISKNRDDLKILWDSTQKGKPDEKILLMFQTAVYG